MASVVADFKGHSGENPVIDLAVDVTDQMIKANKEVGENPGDRLYLVYFKSAEVLMVQCVALQNGNTSQSLWATFQVDYLIHEDPVNGPANLWYGISLQEVHRIAREHAPA